MATVADDFLSALSANGIKYVFANAGTDFAPIIEGLVRANEAGRQVPDFITVPHENVAMAMAQGYYKTCGDVAAAMVHVTVGTANAHCGFLNAARDHTPLMLVAGRTPLTEKGNPGSRNVSIHWAQESFDQGASLREYAKWDYELRSGQPVESLVGRGLDIAMTEPKGPVYLTLPREVLGEFSAGTVPTPRQPGTLAAVPSMAAIERAADAIAGAEYPLIIYHSMYNSAEAYSALSALATEYAVAVCDHAGGSLATDHPMNVGDIRGMPPAFIEIADVIVVMGTAVPWVPAFSEPNADAFVIQIASDPNFGDLPFRGFRSDLSIGGDPALALPLLRDALSDTRTRSKGTIDRRRKRIAESRAPMDEARVDLLKEARSMSPIHPAWTAHCLNEIKDDNAIVINELGLPYAHLSISERGCYIPGGNASGLGRGLGEALGAKLAAPNRQVVAALGDGSYMFSVPTAAHFVGRAEDLPTLTIVSNNAEWFAVRRATTRMYPDGRASKATTLPLVDLLPSPSFERSIEVSGGHGEKVDDPAQLQGAFERAFTAISDGKSALLNVITRAGGR